MSVSGRGAGSGGRGGGRGEYYKNKYGGGRGRGRSGRDSGRDSGRGRGRGGAKRQQQSNSDGDYGGGSYQDLIQTLSSIDNKSYPAYHDIESFQKGWDHNDDNNNFKLYIGRAQSDPYARPTRCRIVVPGSTAQFPPTLYQNKMRATALADYINRAFYATCQSMGADQSAAAASAAAAAAGGGKGWSGPKGGDIQIISPSQHVLQQSAVTIDSISGDVTAQFTVNLPARGRTILGSKAKEIFQYTVPRFVRQSLVYSAFGSARVRVQLQHHVLSIEDQNWLRNQLATNGLVAFVPDGAVLPRASGADDRPMTNPGVVKFISPQTLRVQFHLPNLDKSIQGMGIQKGVNVIVGGGFHGKSTLLSALQLGVYDKIPGDGREFCVCDESAVKIRAEDGRAVTAVDITSFITNLPFGKLTNNFTSMDASGSTSQASNIIEALEVGTKCLLIDEDTAATNFMIRDDKMIALVAPDKEPITPFVKKVRSLFEEKGVSSILVIGGSGDYFDVADTVVMMSDYQCVDVTSLAMDIVASHSEQSKSSVSTRNAAAAPTPTPPFGNVAKRYPRGEAFRPNNKVAVRSKSVLSYGDIDLNLSGLEQIVTLSQTQAISSILQTVPSLLATKKLSLSEIMQLLEKRFDDGGLDELDRGSFNGSMARPRIFEIAGAINRLRSENSITQI